MLAAPGDGKAEQEQQCRDRAAEREARLEPLLGRYRPSCHAHRGGGLVQQGLRRSAGASGAASGTWLERGADRRGHAIRRRAGTTPSSHSLISCLEQRRGTSAHRHATCSALLTTCSHRWSRSRDQWHILKPRTKRSHACPPLAAESRHLIGLKTFGYQPRFFSEQLSFSAGHSDGATFKTYLDALAAAGITSRDRTAVLETLSVFLFGNAGALSTS